MKTRMLGVMLALAMLFLPALAQANTSDNAEQITAGVLKLVGKKATPYAKIFQTLLQVHMGSAMAGGDEAAQLSKAMTRGLREARIAGDGGSNAQVADAVWGVLSKAMSGGDLSKVATSSARRRFNRVLKANGAPGLYVQDAMLNAFTADGYATGSPEALKVERNTATSLLTASRKLLALGRRAPRAEKNFLKQTVSGHEGSQNESDFFRAVNALNKVLESRKSNSQRVAQVDALAKGVGLKWSRRTGRYYTPRVKAPTRRASR